MQTRPYRVHGTNTFEPIGKQGMQALDSLLYCTGCPWDELDILPRPKGRGFLLDGDVPPREC